MKVVCAGSFDPITLGHVDVIERAERLFGEVVVAVGNNSSKRYVFPYEERMELVRGALAHLGHTSVEPLSGLLVDFAAEHGATAIVKGLRFGADFDFELQQAHMNQSLTGIETILLPAARGFVTLSSTILREVFRLGGDVSQYVPGNVNEAIRRRQS
ncbi:pantetheine-phosphate adenylyltransferase [Tessaracoccus sp. OH4464_COT-324]|uniref:pantetheine-phosphate adenylyltransferase n=1 Tax=Tessaracoccus sp. OH4464_COT-324 TaxID=2491059 RepID=UPI000F63B114|nr:pantetheine-phosphate adenylyltransferase [Tessaracoccus sp. OH4464_COT-324]RRD46277.1 pantetheine-phosphate adenylyltransferase [Tessaracoccus sp. OH4464_COT-324]